MRVFGDEEGDAKKETEEARRTGRTFPAKLEVFDQFKTN